MFRHKLALIKADDLGREATLDCWWRLLEALDTRALPMSVGVVADSVSKYDGDELSRLAIQFRDCGHEVWNHSYSHADFSKLTLEEQAVELRKSQDIIADRFGARPTVFGAPFNSMNPETVRATEENGDFTGVYFARFPTRLVTIPYDNLCPPEYVKGFYRQPDFRAFGQRLLRRREYRPIVLQVHPAAWSQYGLNEFARIIDLLIQEEWQFITFAEYAQYRTWALDGGQMPDLPRAEMVAVDEMMTDSLSHAPPSPDAPVDFVDWYSRRYERGTTFLTSVLKRAGFHRNGGPGEQVGLDIGCGAGNWTVAYAALSPKHRGVGVDITAYTMKLLNSALPSSPISNRVSFRTASILQLPDAGESYDHVICNNALNYVPLEPALREVHRVLKSGGTFYLGVQNRRFWLRGFVDALIERKLPGAMTRIDQLGYATAFAYGLPPGANYAWIWSTNGLGTIAEHIGLNVRFIDPPAMSERVHNFEGLSVLTLFLLVKAEPVPITPASFIREATGEVSLSGLTDLFLGGMERHFLECVEGVCARTGRLTFDNQFEHLVTTAALMIAAAGGEVGPFCRQIAARHGDFAAAAEAHLRKDYGRAADMLMRLAARYPEDHSLSAPTIMALYSANRLADARRFALGALGDDEDEWSEDDWMVWMAAVTAAENIDAARSTLRRYLQRRLDRMTETGTTDLPAMMKGMYLTEPMSADLLKAAYLHSAIGSLQ
jgi:ubiquinone/menaquinone biosynthesis C-methylase UbiE/peptidoglycan/xylan/chitin deacetylase (PgdA/CDA1 family)